MEGECRGKFCPARIERDVLKRELASLSDKLESGPNDCSNCIKLARYSPAFAKLRGDLRDACEERDEARKAAHELMPLAVPKKLRKAQAALVKAQGSRDLAKLRLEAVLKERDALQCVIEKAHGLHGRPIEERRLREAMNDVGIGLEAVKIALAKALGEGA